MTAHIFAMATTISHLFKRVYPALGGERQREFEAKWQRLELPQGAVLLSEGQVSRRAFLIEKGCLRVWFMRKGRDVTAQFFFENEGLSSIESFRTGMPSLFTIETLEPSVVWALSKEDYNEVEREARKDVRTLSMLLDVAYKRQIHYMKLFRSFIGDRPEERYGRLVAEEPHIVERVPQRYIASYLGITPESLSRIRARRAKSGSDTRDRS
jgi:CRP-like cAMP-binding protein